MPNNMKKLLVILLLLSSACFGQNDTVPEIISDKIYKLDLRFPAQCIDKIEYNKSKRAVKYELSEDGRTVYIKEHIVGNGVKVECTYKDGNRDQFSKTPCAIELVVPL